jgi:hypothetical protein
VGAKQGEWPVLDLGAANVDLVQHVLDRGYSSNLTEDQVSALRADPFIVAHALADPGNRCAVSNESPKPTRQPHNRKIPDACARLNIQCVPATTHPRAEVQHEVERPTIAAIGSLFFRRGIG